MSIVKEDFCKAALATLVPGAAGVACFGIFYTDIKDMMQWWSGLKKPCWAPKNINVYSAMDTAVSLPLGCASYLVYKHGGGFDDDTTKLALAVYGANLALNLISIPILAKKRSTKLLLSLTGVVTASTLATAILFFKVHKPAGYMLIPCVSWCGFYVVLMSMMIKDEGKTKPKE